MTPQNKLTNKTSALARPMLFGASIGLLLILVFLYGVKNPNPGWGKFWMAKPLLMVPFAGAMGGLFLP